MKRREQRKISSSNKKRIYQKKQMKNHACQLKKKGNEREIKKLKIIS
jgi:hypothetical protein